MPKSNVTAISQSKAPAIPESVRAHVNHQQRAAYTIEALLAGAIALAKEAAQDDIEWSLEHIQGLVKQLGEQLDMVNLSRACEVQS